MFVVDTAARSILLFDRDEKRFRRVSRAGKEKLVSPIDIAVTPEGRFFVSDSALGRVFAFNGNGKFLFEIGSTETLQRPTGLALSRTNRLLYVVDTQKHQISVFNETGEPRFSFGSRGTAEGEFNFPTNIFTDSRGQVYVTDFLNFRVQIFTPEGKFLKSIGSPGDKWENLVKPKGVAVDREGHIYIVDSINDQVKIFDPEGRFLLFFGGTGNGPGEFYLPSGIFIDGEDRIYVSDSFNHRIHVFQYLFSDSVPVQKEAK